MKLGISSYTYVWSVGVPGYPRASEPMSVFALLDKAIELGVRVVQIADNLPLDQLSFGELESLRHQAKDSGIELEVGTLGIQQNHLRLYLELASRLSSPILRTVLDTETHQPSQEEVVSTFKEVLPEFEAADVTLAVENHDRFNAKTLLAVMDDVGSDHLGICFDTANSIGCLESPEIVMDVLEQHIVNLHMKDLCILRPRHNKGFVVEGRPAGQGRLDIPKLMNRLKTMGRDVNVIVELWPPPQPTLAESMDLEVGWAKESVQYMRTHIAE